MTDIQALRSPAESARLFRTILSAFAKPAVPVPLLARPAAPAPLLSTTAAVLLSLCDYQTPVWLSPLLDREAVSKFIRFHTGAPVTAEPGEAAFAVLSAEEALTFMGLFSTGTDEYPDRSATLILQTAGLTADGDMHVSGPGLKEHVPLSASGTDAMFWKQVQDNTLLFPKGLDFVFASPDSIAALPRSMTVVPREIA